MASETFSPTFSLHPDFQGAANWSGGVTPGTGTAAVVNAIASWVEPLANIAADVTLAGGAALIGNQSGFLLSGTLLATDSDALYANGAIINQGVISASGEAANLRIVVQAGSNIAANYGLTIASFENRGSIAIGNGASLNICGTELSNTGTIRIDDAALSVTGGWVDGGQGPLTPGGLIELSHGAIASFDEGITDQTFDFTGPGTIIVSDPVDVSNIAIANFGYRDEIIATSVTAANALLNSSLFFATPLPSGETFTVQPTSFGAVISLAREDAFPCFAAGTAILGPDGYVPVEHLEPGDLILTASGTAVPIRWIGWRGIELARHHRPDAVCPVRITAGALAPGAPARDLILSPDHAIFLHGHLVPVKLLINGITIRRETTCRSITYFHIELDRHDIIIAENLPVETYLDTGNRNAFANANHNTHGRPHAAPVFGRGRQWNEFACADLCLAGPILQNIRRDLFNRTASYGYEITTDFHIALCQHETLIAAHDGTTHAAEFMLPPGTTGPLAIRSAAFIPAEFSNGSAPEEDWRRLGIAISRIKLDHHQTSLGNIARSGVHPRGAGDEAEWTDGNALINIPPNTKTITLALQAFPKRWQPCTPQ
jgi:hypothetical protein